MTAAIRRFVTHWKPWAIRWTDHRMAPTCAPFFVGDGGRGEFFVGPYLSEQGEIRDELVRYKDFAAAARELYLEPGDFLAASVWTKQLAPMGSIADALDLLVKRATRLLSAAPPNRQEYLRVTTHIVKMSLEAYRAYHQGDEAKPIAEVPVIPRSVEGISDLFRARLADRDHRVSSAATARLAELAPRGRLVGPERQG